MLYSVSGKLIVKKSNFVVINAGGLGIKIFISNQTAKSLPEIGSDLMLFTSFCVKKDGVEVYGFLNESELDIFNLLNSISGVGPKTSMGILGAVATDKLLSAINQNRADVIVENSNIGKKKAERIVLELRDKIKNLQIENISLNESDKEIKLALKSLGYKTKEIEEALSQISNEHEEVQDRLKAVLRILSSK